MDWFSWLSKTTLDPSLVYEYGLALSHNELEQEDIVYFNHEFLQSIGISIAKHRLEILKLARKDGALHPRPITRLLLAIKRTKRCFAKLIRNFSVHDGDDSKALVVVPKSTYSGKLLKRNKKLMVAKQQGRFLLTNGSPAPGVWPRIESFSGPLVYDLRRDEKKEEEEEDGYWSNGVEEIRWDTMFQNLKPT
ncbi:uncharacterized protein LOC111493318 [Cucurbita maxima]|uniref:Uncharacterized protein LOC111493318 n=1 Tax=Cucurbita maxima TaxID=3661 RepID=A0A6J1K8U0_CUCMA|nr:uncharacterized protein LOC111493318 [Cucurbita maxima]